MTRFLTGFALALALSAPSIASDQALERGLIQYAAFKSNCAKGNKAACNWAAFFESQIAQARAACAVPAHASKPECERLRRYEGRLPKPSVKLALRGAL